MTKRRMRMFNHCTKKESLDSRAELPHRPLPPWNVALTDSVSQGCKDTAGAGIRDFANTDFTGTKTVLLQRRLYPEHCCGTVEVKVLGVFVDHASVLLDQIGTLTTGQKRCEFFDAHIRVEVTTND